MTTTVHGYAHQHELFKDLILPWCLGVCVAFPWVFVFALPPLQVGIWFNTEGVALCLASLGIISSFILLLITGRHIFYGNPSPQIKLLKWSGVFNSLQTNALLVAICSLSIISIITLPFSNNMQLSWFGHPEQMTGGWLWLSISTILLCHIWFKQYSDNVNHMRAIRISTTLACYTQIALVLFAHPKFANASGDWVLYHFTAHLGWIGACLFILSIQKNGKIFLMPLFLGVLAILLSHNKIAISGLILGPFVYLIISKYSELKNKNKYFFLFISASPLILFFSEFMAFYLHIFPTLSSRFISLKVIWLDIIESPFKNILIGRGWGQMSDSIIRQLPTLKLANPQLINWEGIGRYDASSLNQTADAFAAIGIAGAFFSFLIPISPFLKAKKYFTGLQTSTKKEAIQCLLFTSFLICILLHHGWFIMLSTFPIFISTVMTIDFDEDANHQ